MNGSAKENPQTRLSEGVTECLDRMDLETQLLVAAITAATGAVGGKIVNAIFQKATAYWSNLPFNTKVAVIVPILCIVLQRIATKADAICMEKPEWCSASSELEPYVQALRSMARTVAMAMAVLRAALTGPKKTLVVGLVSIAVDTSTSDIMRLLPFAHRTVSFTALVIVACAHVVNIPQIKRLQLPLSLFLCVWLLGDERFGGVALLALTLLACIPFLGAVALLLAPGQGASAVRVALYLAPETEIFVAAKSGNLTNVKLLCRNKSTHVNEGKRFGPFGCLLSESPLYEAAERGYSEIVAELLNKGANCKCGVTSGPLGSLSSRSPLGAAAARGDLVAVKALLKKGADTRQGYTLGPFGSLLSISPLQDAAEKGFSEVVGALLDAHADPQLGGTLGPFGIIARRSPLYEAADQGHTEVVRKLLRARAIIPQRGFELLVVFKLTPLLAAATGAHEDVKDLLEVAQGNTPSAPLPSQHNAAADAAERRRNMSSSAQEPRRAALSPARSRSLEVAQGNTSPAPLPSRCKAAADAAERRRNA